MHIFLDKFGLQPYPPSTSQKRRKKYMPDLESLVELLKKLHELKVEDIEFLKNYLQCTRSSFEKEMATRTRQKKGKKDLIQALDSLDKFESVFSYLASLNVCTLESLISQAEDLESSIEITKLYEKTKELETYIESLLQQQLEATKIFNNKWTSTRKLTLKEKRNEKVYLLWKDGKSVVEIKEEIDCWLSSQGEKEGIGRQTIYNLINNFKKSDARQD